MEKLKIAAFGGFRSIPPKAGAAGADKFAFELYPRIVKQGHEVLAYCRIYPGDKDQNKNNFEGVKIKYFKTVKKAGLDSLLHSCKATFDVIFHNRADIVHLNSGANSIWAIFLRLAGKRVILSQFAMDWKRDKWSWYGKLFYRLSNYITAYIPNKVVFDNIFSKEYFEKKFRKKYVIIPFGSEVRDYSEHSDILERLNLISGNYFLFVGRFIPDKGLHILIEAFKKINTDKKLVLVGGSPNPDSYETKIKNVTDARILFPGYIYGVEVNFLIKNTFAYIQPSLIEGLSPVILTVMGMGTPLICSDIPENLFITKENAFHFKSGDAEALKEIIEESLENYETLQQKAIDGQADVRLRFNWESVSERYIELFRRKN